MNDDSHLIDPEAREERVKARVLDEQNGPGYVCWWQDEHGAKLPVISYDFEEIDTEIELDDGSVLTFVDEEKIEYPHSYVAFLMEQKARKLPLPYGGKILAVPYELQRDYLESIKMDARLLNAHAQDKGDAEILEQERQKAAFYNSTHQAWLDGDLDSISSFALVRLRQHVAQDEKAARAAGAVEIAEIKRRVVKHCDALLAKHRIVN